MGRACCQRGLLKRSFGKNIMRTCKIHFQPDDITIVTEAGQSLLAAAQQAGIIINSVCGGAGTCNKCLIEVDGISEPVQACRFYVERDLMVNVPESSRFFEQKILQEGIALGSCLNPQIAKYFVQLSEPCLDDLRSDTQRLIDAVKEAAGVRRSEDEIAVDTVSDTAGENLRGTIDYDLTIDFTLLPKLPGLLRDNSYTVTALCHGRHIIDLEPGNTTDKKYGLAADIGTTTVVVELVDLTNGKKIAVASQSNPQITFGDDVIGRIDYSRTHKDGLQQLRERITEGINRLIAEICEKSGIDRRYIYELTAVGNSTMQQLLLGIPVESIGQAPYVSTVTSAIDIPAVELGIDISPAGNVYVMPTVAAHVGGDTVAVALSTAMRHSESVNLALDIGTNGELVLGNRDRLLACSTAAGPAFEGARIKQGMRGATGAIERVYIGDDVEVVVIGEGKCVGICGSGLIDAIAELLNVGILDSSGRMLVDDELPASLPPKLRERVVKNKDGLAFILAHSEQSRQDGAIVLTQRDIREAQLAKAAISAGAVVLMRQMRIELADVEHLYLAGAFGNYIRPESARRIGLLPDLPLEKIQFVGNAAASGAREVLICREARQHAQSLAQRIEYVELAGRSEFQTLFSDCMFFPEK